MTATYGRTPRRNYIFKDKIPNKTTEAYIKADTYVHGAVYIRALALPV